MCICLCSCGSGQAVELTPEEKVLGTWIQEETGETVVIEEDGVGTYTGDDFGTSDIEWSYDSEAKEFTVYIIGLGFTGELNSSGDVFTLDIDNEKVDLIRQAE